MRRSEERDHALTQRAQRELEEVAAERARFELMRDKLIFGSELFLAAVFGIAIVVALVRDPDLMPLLLLSSGGAGGLAIFRRRKSDP